MKITLLDTKTGLTKEHSDDSDAWWWYEGNGSCDCNRALYIGVYEDIPEEFTECSGCKRFLIIACDDKTYTLQELNENYPAELLKKHLPKNDKPRTS